MVFEVDDGTVRAHRALLTSRSDVMASMFTNDFLEKSAKLVPNGVVVSSHCLHCV